MSQFVEGARFLRLQRATLLSAPHIRLRYLALHDERLLAHLDGLLVSEEAGWRMALEALAEPNAGVAFVLTVMALEQRRTEEMNRLFALAETIPTVLSGISSGLGWASADLLRGLVSKMLHSPRPAVRYAGISACALHRVDPGAELLRALQSDTPRLVARAARAVGELHRSDLMSECLKLLGSEDGTVQFWAAWSAALLGDRGQALEVLESIALGSGPQKDRALASAIQMEDPRAAHSLLVKVRQVSENPRRILMGAGLAGDVGYLAWIMEQMTILRWARIAGEAFSLIVGVDLVSEKLDQPRPDDFQSGPNDDPNDPDVEMDKDDGLPWPDATKIQAWWKANAHRFQPGTRYFMGQPLNRENCVRVLKEGFQRQRIAAALYLSLLNPGTPLFEWRAPARRQQRLLAEMT